MNLPPDFTSYTSVLFGPDRWARFVKALEEPAPVSVRLNPFKCTDENLFAGQMPIPWCQHAFWLPQRPNFTQDPLFHAGVYYVQEAGSLFLDWVLRQQITTPVSALDLCAAPGGKSTLMRAALPEGSVLVSNEPDRRRANILLENMLKQGHPGVLVTHNHARDFHKAGLVFDLILTDVPCSGEGLFRKDPAARQEWSAKQVLGCQQRQRDILQEIWPCLREGGLLIYSTCTFNTKENEENVRWIMDELDADLRSVCVPQQWAVTGSLLGSFQAPVYRFIPGITRSEGLFMAVLCKRGGAERAILPKSLSSQIASNKLFHLLTEEQIESTPKAGLSVPSAAQALSLATPPDAYPAVELSLEQALRYLHRESFALPPDTPRGFVRVTYHSYPLGFMKNVGDRANNLYPKPWALKTL